ncbi:MAG TPA: peptide chain release factor N(5)-glutamine methyltransferase [Acidobacteriaceae bacterium]|nr:peptide chain release factor N(5)-glutamine methyltransferase [Acidobacteriaceae bacterium]
MPVNAGAALEAARARLAATSKNPRRDAGLLLAHVLGCDQTALLTHPERLLSAAELQQFDRLVERRLASEPMQYLTGEQEFFGLSFEVSPAVLIPRPETEHLVEAVLHRFGREEEVRIVDVGTGSGAIAVSLAHAMPRSRVTAVDLLPSALDVARRNAERHGVIDQLVLLPSDLLAEVEGTDFDAVVANPPYIATAEVLEPQVANYEPHSALYAGPTGLEVYERLIPQAARVLKPGGWLMLEIGYGQSSALKNLMHGWAGVTLVNDLQGIPRVVLGQKQSATLK